mgnify:CR=1 FL=1
MKACKLISKQTTKAGLRRDTSQAGQDLAEYPTGFLAGFEAESIPILFLIFTTNLANYPAKNWLDIWPDSLKLFPRENFLKGQELSNLGAFLEKS